MHPHAYATLSSKLSCGMPTRSPIIAAHANDIAPQWAVVVVAYDATSASDMHGGAVVTRVATYSYDPTALNPQFKHEPFQFGEASTFTGDTAYGHALLDFAHRMEAHATMEIANA